MSDARFLQIHTLTSYPGTLLNRDDAGFAKRLPFGGTTRTRVSSQCLKYHWRNFDGEYALQELDVTRSVRSRETFQRKVAQPLIDDGLPASLVRAAVYLLKELVLNGTKPKKSKVTNLLKPESDEDAWQELETKQITIFGLPEINYLKGVVEDQVKTILADFPSFKEADAELSKEAVEGAVSAIRDISTTDLKKNLKGLNLSTGLDAALFGRMVTSDILARSNGAIHVAHAITTHEEESESDYFSAVDELRRDEPDESGELGAGHINSQEMTSGLFYGYITVDVPLLVSNLEGIERNEWKDADKTLAAGVVEHLIHLVSTVSPGAKLGSTAPYSYAQMVLVEAGKAQPRTLANAFQQAVPTHGEGVLAHSYQALGQYVSQMDRMYGKRTERKLAVMEPVNGLLEELQIEENSSVPEIAQWAADQVGGV